MTSSRDFGWWIQSTDDELYGPVTKQTLLRFLTEGAISPNTQVRHCSETVFTPIADLGMLTDLGTPAKLRSGDTLSTSWPKKTKDRLALAVSDVECTYHRKPAILSCIRCQGAYCNKCQLKKGKKTYLMCKKCQASLYNRRSLAYFLDGFALNLLPVIGAAFPAIILLGPEQGSAVVNLVSFLGLGLFLVRDPLFGGAGPGKRLFGLKVVSHQDGTTPVTYAQGFVRCLAHLIPIFNLVDASSPYSDPLQRRYGDHWAKTRVIETDDQLAKVQMKTEQRLEKKGIELTDVSTMTPAEFARTD